MSCGDKINQERGCGIYGSADLLDRCSEKASLSR